MRLGVRSMGKSAGHEQRAQLDSGSSSTPAVQARRELKLQAHREAGAESRSAVGTGERGSAVGLVY